MSPKEASANDPQLRVLLDVVASTCYVTHRPPFSGMMRSISDNTHPTIPHQPQSHSGVVHRGKRLDKAMLSNDQVTFLSWLNLAASSQTPLIGRKPAVSITIIEDDALSLRPKRRFCANGGDAGNDQLHVLGLLRRLLAVPISSPLGRRMIQYVETNLPGVGSCLNPCTVAHTLFGTNGTPEYGAFCRATGKSALNGGLYYRQFPVRFRHDNTIGYCHQYRFSRADRREFCKRYDTGLCSQSRRLQKRFANSCVSLYNLTPEEIDDWRTSQRLRDVVEKQYPVIYINLIDSDESESEEQSDKRDYTICTSESSVVVPKMPASPASAKRPALKTQPAILKRHKSIEASISSTSVITVSSDSEDDELTTDKTYTFHCHRCSAKFSCGAQFNEMVESHYRIEHGIHNVNLQCHTSPNGEMSLSVVQSSTTSETSLPSSGSQPTQSLPHVELPLWTPHRLAFVSGIKPSNTVDSLPSATTTSGAFNVPTSTAHVIAISSRMAATSGVVPVSDSLIAVTSSSAVFKCQTPVASSSLLSISRMRGFENAAVMQSAAVSVNNCSRSLINGVGSPPPTLCEPDVICID